MRRGFTLVEVLVAVVILALISVFGLTVSARSYRRGAIDAERDTLRGALEKARSAAMANFNGEAHGLAVTADAYVVFQGDSYDDRDEDYDQAVPRTPGFVVAGPTEIVFQPLEATVDDPGTLVVANEVKSLSIIVNEEGRIQW